MAAIVATCTDYAASWLEGDPDRMAACLARGLAKRTPVEPGSSSLVLDESSYADMVASAGRGPRPHPRDLDIVVRSAPWLDLVHVAWFGDPWRSVNAINIGARIGAQAGPSEVLVSSTVRDLVSGSGLVFEDAGEHRLKGLPEPWQLYRAV